MNPFGLPHLPGGATEDIYKKLQGPLSQAVRSGLGEPAGPPRPGDLDWSTRRPDQEEPLIGAVEELTLEQLEAAAALAGNPANRPTPGVPLPATKRIKAWHHEAARLMASGVRDNEICQVMSCSPSTLSALRRSPAFQNILLAYSIGPEEEAFSAAAKIRATALLALERAEEILSDTTKPMNSKFLTDVLFGLLDRAGFSPVTKSLNLSGGLTPDAIAQIREAVGGRATIIDVDVARPEPEAAAEPEVGASGSDEEALARSAA